MMVHILLGPPGSGKGTQAKQLVHKMSLVHLSTGDILRAAVLERTEVGIKAKKIMDSGQLVNDEVINAMVFDKLRNETRDVLFDGYPRTAFQAVSLQNFLDANKIKLGFVMEIGISEKVLEARIINRRVCSNSACGAIYNLNTKMPVVSGICDLCGCDIKHRADDTIEAFVRRMIEFNKTYQPLKDFYVNMSNYRYIDGDNSQEEVHNKLIQLFREQD